MSQENASPVLRFEVSGLRAPATIVIDKFGVPHIRARSRLDLFFCQGFQAARDRLWQIDLWRKRGLGLLAGDFGPGYLAQDKAARLFLFRGDIEAEWLAYGVPDAKEIATAFVTGINSYISLVERDPSLLPPEFVLLGNRPALWVPEDVVRIRSHALIYNSESEIARATVESKLNRELDLLRQRVDPQPPTEYSGIVDLGSFPDQIMDKFRLATAPVTFDKARLSARLEEADRWNSSYLRDRVISHHSGSNNWAIGPGRTLSGRPILASDPHRSLDTPSLRYVVHLSAPGLNVIGAGEPAVPGVSIGHNDNIAFGLTIFPCDQQDLIIYQTSGPDDRLYEGGGITKEFQVCRERIPVKGDEDNEVELRFSDQGPIIYRTGNTAFGLRSVWSEPGAAAYLGSLAYMNAVSHSEFADSLQHWSVPPVNQVVASIDGHIAHYVAAKVPKRTGDSGLLPIPGDELHDWSGFHSPESLPRVIDPECGYVASANELNPLFRDQIAAMGLGFEFSEPWRANRILDFLESTRGDTVPTSCQLQMDTFSYPGKRIQQLTLPDETVAKRLIASWDCHLRSNSNSAVLFEVWWERHLKPATITKALAGAGFNSDLAVHIGPGDNESCILHLENLHPEERRALIDKTLDQAFAECVRRLGDDPGRWEWGQLHLSDFKHPLVGLDAEFDELSRVPSCPLDGSGSTVCCSAYDSSNFLATEGASFRMVLDVGSWDNSLFINAPGQSGDPRSPSYCDQVGDWVVGGYRPLLFTTELIDQSTKMVVDLIPTRR